MLTVKKNDARFSQVACGWAGAGIENANRAKAEKVKRGQGNGCLTIRKCIVFKETVQKGQMEYCKDRKEKGLNHKRENMQIGRGGGKDQSCEDSPWKLD